MTKKAKVKTVKTHLFRGENTVISEEKKKHLFLNKTYMFFSIKTVVIEFYITNNKVEKKPK